MLAHFNIDWGNILLILFVAAPLWLIGGWVALAIACRTDKLSLWALMIRSALVQFAGMGIQGVIFLLAAVVAEAIQLESNALVQVVKGVLSVAAYGLVVGALVGCGWQKVLRVALVQSATTGLLIVLVAHPWVW